MKTRRFLRGAMLAAAVLTGMAGFYSCSQDEGEAPGDGSRVAVQFTSQVAGADMATQKAAAPKTRTAEEASGTRWATGDQVGIFMLNTTVGTLSGGILSGVENVQHNVNSVTGALTPADAAQTIYYPQSGNVDFIAYYPWRTTPGTDAYIYKVSVADQSDPAAIDVLYAKATDVARSKTAVGLAFEHVMSKITINVTLGNGMTSFSGSNITTVGFSGMPQTATVALQDGALTAGAAGYFTALKAAIPGSSFAATFSAILVPQAASAYTSRTAVFTVDGVAYTWTIPDGAVFAPGSHYTYPITIKKTGVTAGTPTITDWTASDNGTGTATEIGSGIAKVRIPAGTFQMGSPANEPNRRDDETQHKVTLTKDFYMSKYQITNAQYAAFLNAKVAEGTLSFGNTTGTYNFPNAAYFDIDKPLVLDCTTGSRSQWGVTRNTNETWVPVSGYENFPVIYVTWYGAKAFADWVGGALPTEAQWEYACRGGQSTSLPFGIGNGKKLTHEMANFYTYYPYDLDKNPPGEYNDPSGTNYNMAATTAVGSYPYPNGYGLYDMHGNVWEWCYDSWEGAAYAPGAVTDPVSPHPGSGGFRVLRGGSWSNRARGCRSAYRNDDNPGSAGSVIGFRVVFPL